MHHFTKNHGTKMKKNLIITVLFLVLFLGCKSNTYKIEVDKNVSKDLIRIEVFSNTTNQTHIIYKSGKFMPHSTNYGENNWSIFYDDKLVIKYREFIYNRNDVSDYNFVFSKKVDSLIINFRKNDKVIF